MPYSVGEKGSYGCSGYPAVKEGGEVMGCHDTKEEAAAQIYAINQSEGNIDKQSPCWDGYVQRGMKPKDGKMVPNCVPVSKADRPIMEGDYVMGGTSEGMVVGQVEHIMIEGGTYGPPGTEYAIESTPENPAMAVRVFEQEEDGKFCATAYSIGMLYSNAIHVDIEIAEEDEEDDDEISKADSYAPSWSRSIVKRMENKTLFADFGKDYTKSTPLQIFKADH